MRLHCPGNIKVHWAGAEVQNQYLATDLMGVNYHLYTAYPFVERMVFDKPKSPIMPLKWMKGNEYEDIPQNIIQHNLHTIQDSGLFTLLYGSRKGTANEAVIAKWYDALVQFTLEHASGATIVEVDCQDIIGVEKAWEYRERMRRDLPGYRIINVWHPVGGVEDLDRMIEFSDYIAFSAFAYAGAQRAEMCHKVAAYIKNRKPSIDIHILGCTNAAILEACKFCTSSDSTTWTGVKRYGFIDGAHQSRIKKEAVDKIIDEAVWNAVREYNSPTNTNGLLTNIERLKRRYEECAGPQDYFVNKKHI